MSMKFTEVEVIEHLVKAYKEAGKPTYPHENLYRGRNHKFLDLKNCSVLI
ncbi:hypothetical protein ACV566_03815 [Staphylococcus aureus]